MTKCCTTWVAVLAALAALALVSVPALAAPLSGVTYHYVPGLIDANGNGEWTFNSLNSLDSAETKLTDGVLGSLVPAAGEPVAFTNGTWTGYLNDTAFEGHPTVDLDLGGTYQVSSVSVQYLIEAPPFIFAPQPCAASDPACFGGVDAMTVSGSTDGISYASLGASNAFEPIFGPTGSIALNTVDARWAVFDFGPGGTTAAHIRVDVRTPFSWIFLGEIVVDAVPEPATMTLWGMSTVGLVLGIRRRSQRGR